MKNKLQIIINVTVTETERDWRSYAKGESEARIDLPRHSTIMPNVDVMQMVEEARDEFEREIAERAAADAEQEPQP